MANTVASRLIRVSWTNGQEREGKGKEGMEEGGNLPSADINDPVPCTPNRLYIAGVNNGKQAPTTFLRKDCAYSPYLKDQ